MSRPDLDAIEARADAATPGPWFHVSTDDESNMCADYVGTVDRGDRHDNRRGMAPGTPRFGEVVAITLIQTPLLAAHESDLFGENADLIANARTDIPALVAYARELEAATFTRDEAAALVAWLGLVEGHRAFMLARQGSDGVEEWQRFVAAHPEIVAARTKLAALSGVKS